MHTCMPLAETALQPFSRPLSAQSRHLVSGLGLGFSFTWTHSKELVPGAQKACLGPTILETKP